MACCARSSVPKARDEGAGVEEDPQPAEGCPADDVLERLASDPSCQEDGEVLWRGRCLEK